MLKPNQTLSTSTQPVPVTAAHVLQRIRLPLLVAYTVPFPSPAPSLTLVPDLALSIHQVLALAPTVIPCSGRANTSPHTVSLPNIVVPGVERCLCEQVCNENIGPVVSVFWGVPPKGGGGGGAGLAKP